MTLTLQMIKDRHPSIADWKKLINAVGDNLTTELSIGDVVIANGLDDALWCLQCLEPRHRVAAVMPAVKRASAYATDQRVHDCIAAVEQWLAGDDTVDLETAARAAGAAGAASWAARAARAAEAGAARAAGAASWAARAARAAWAAEWAAGAAARAAEWAAERKQQEADLLAMFPPMVLEVTQ